MSARGRILVQLAKEVFNDDLNEGETNGCDSDMSITSLNYDPVYVVSERLVDSNLEKGDTEFQNLEPSFQNGICIGKESNLNSINNTQHVTLHDNLGIDDYHNSGKIWKSNNPPKFHVPEKALTVMNFQNVEPYLQNSAENSLSNINTMLYGEENLLKSNITESVISEDYLCIDHYTNRDLGKSNSQIVYEGTNYSTDGFLLNNKSTPQNEASCFQNEISNNSEGNLYETGELNQNNEHMKSSSKIKDIYKSPLLIKNKYKITVCTFCDSDIISKHFARHLERLHNNEIEVKEILNLDKGNLERKKLLALLRNRGNLEPALRGHINPKKRELGREASENDYAICTYCNGYFKRLCLSRHVKKCFANENKNNEKKHSRPLSESIVYTACKKKYGNILNKLSVKTEIFNKMQADIVTKTAINDILIAHFGEDLLKKNKSKRSLYHISNKVRECGRFLLEMRKHGEYPDILSTLKPMNFDDAIAAIKNISRYNIETKAFGAASLALHFGTTLKKLADLATKIIFRNKIPNFTADLEKTLIDLKRFRKLVDTQWATELGSIALKNLNEKASIKPKLLPLTEDIIKLKNFVEEKSNSAYEKLKTTKTLEHYKTLVETTLVSTIIHNRKRVGDIQYLDLSSYKEQMMNETNVSKQTELTSSLSENEKILTKHYLRIIAIGKGSRAVTILIPKTLQKYFSMIHKIRQNTPAWFSSKNTYFFTYPQSTRWIDGCSVLRRYAKICSAKNPELLTSSRLRKHIATVTQVLNLRENEIAQLAKFMGHSTRTHEQFYKLPQDVYQVAKVSKILQLMEKGNAAQFKNCSLEEIDIDMDNVLEDEGIPESNENSILASMSTNTKRQEETRTLQDIDIDNLVDEGTHNNHENSLVATTLSEYEKKTLNNLERNSKNNDSDDTDSTFVVSDSESSESDSCWNETKTQLQKKKQERNTDCAPILSRKSVMKAKPKERWTQQQKTHMQKYFKNFIKERKAPRKNDCEKFIEKHTSFAGIQWIRVKTYVYNFYRLQ